MGEGAVEVFELEVMVKVLVDMDRERIGVKVDGVLLELVVDLQTQFDLSGMRLEHVKQFVIELLVNPLDGNMQHERVKVLLLRILEQFDLLHDEFVFSFGCRLGFEPLHTCSALLYGAGDVNVEVGFEHGRALCVGASEERHLVCSGIIFDNVSAVRIALLRDGFFCRGNDTAKV